MSTDLIISIAKNRKSNQIIDWVYRNARTIAARHSLECLLEKESETWEVILTARHNTDNARVSSLSSGVREIKKYLDGFDVAYTVIDPQIEQQAEPAIAYTEELFREQPDF